MQEICKLCGKSYPIGAWPYCPHGMITPANADYHSSEKTVIHIPPSGNIQHAHIPGRADKPMNPKLAAHGYTRVELNRHERESFVKKRGLHSEAGNFNSGNGIGE